MDTRRPVKCAHTGGVHCVKHNSQAKSSLCVCVCVCGGGGEGDTDAGSRNWQCTALDAHSPVHRNVSPSNLLRLSCLAAAAQATPAMS